MQNNYNNVLFNNIKGNCVIKMYLNKRNFNFFCLKREFISSWGVLSNRGCVVIAGVCVVIVTLLSNYAPRRKPPTRPKTANEQQTHTGTPVPQ